MLRLLIICSMMFFIGCSTTIPISVERAPLVKLPDVQVITVKPLRTQGDIQVGTTSNSSIIRLIEVNQDQLTKRFKLELRQLLQSQITQRVSRSPNLSIVDFKSRADAAIRPQLFLKVQDQGQWIESQDGDGLPISRYSVTRTVEVQLFFDFLHRYTHEVMGSGELRKVLRDTQEDISSRGAHSRLKNWEEMSKSALISLMPQMSKYFIPYRQTYKVKLLEGDDDRLEEGADLAGDSDWVGAKSLWRDVHDRSPGSASNEDRAKAAHNLGVMFEHKANYEWSRKWYEKALKLYSLSEARQGIQRASSAEDQQKKINEMNQTVNDQPKSQHKSEPEPKKKSIHRVLGF